MNIQEKLLDSFHTITKSALAVLLGIVTVSVYLVQRAFLYSFGDEVDRMEQMGQEQAGFVGVPFAFATLSVLWPVILSCICAGFCSHIAAHQRVWSRLVTADPPVKGGDILATDGFYHWFIRTSWVAHVIWWLVIALPFLAVGAHLLAGYLCLSDASQPPGRIDVSKIDLGLLKVLCWIRMGMSLLGIVIMARFPRSVICAVARSCDTTPSRTRRSTE